MHGNLANFVGQDRRKMAKSSLDNFGTKINRWKPGQSGNPKGRPPKLLSITNLIKERLEKIDEKTGKTYAQLIAEKLVELALDGDHEAHKEILNRIDGKVVEKHEIEGHVPVTLIFKPAFSSTYDPLPSIQNSIEEQEKPPLLGSNSYS
jgi:hypothetical protein